jgi:hypothetical protein
MLKRSSVLLLMGAIALGGFVLWLEGRSPSDSTQSAQSSSLSSTAEQDAAIDSTAETPVPIFDFEEADIESFTVKRPSDSLSFRKSAQDGWQMVSPNTGPAEEGVVAFLLSQLTNPATHSFTAQADALKEFGLDKPTLTVSLVAKGKPYELAVGGTDFTGDKLYVRKLTSEGETASEAAGATEDASTEQAADNVTIYVVSGGMSNAVKRPIAEWLLAGAPSSAPSTKSDAGATTAESANSTADPASSAAGSAAGSANSAATETPQPSTAAPGNAESTAQPDAATSPAPPAQLSPNNPPQSRSAQPPEASTSQSQPAQ